MIYLNGQPLPVTIFPDNTSQVWKVDINIKQADIVWEYSTEREFLQLAQLKTLLDSYHILPVKLTLTYLPYARQDKEVSNESTFALRVFADLLNSLKFDKVTISDPHSAIALDLIRNSIAVYPVYELQKAVVQTWADVICYPDKGAVEKYTKIKEMPYVNFPYIYGEKVRDQLTGNILNYKVTGDPSGKSVLIVDDICDGGMTFKLLAKDLLSAGAKEVNLFVTHGIFSKGVRTLKESGINRVFTKDGEVSARYSNFHL